MRNELVARIDREKAYAFFLENQGWDRETVDQQVLTPLDEANISEHRPTRTPSCATSCQVPSPWMGSPSEAGDINATDAAYLPRSTPRWCQCLPASGPRNGKPWRITPATPQPPLSMTPDQSCRRPEWPGWWSWTSPPRRPPGTPPGRRRGPTALHASEARSSGGKGSRGWSAPTARRSSPRWGRSWPLKGPPPPSSSKRSAQGSDGRR